MVQLLLETATDVCSVALARDGQILAERTATEAHQHASHLTLFIDEVMQKAGTKLTELNEVVLSDGPGSYTSLRVGAATAKGLCLALPGLSLRVVPTLAALMLAAKPYSIP
ncbi:MAG: tRNA (adenosine(37)-N6)-threonylcarbamoyltransferase complex dimerization subunit type 1 TsaB, partial [Bacteroidota bacterium]